MLVRDFNEFDLIKLPFFFFNLTLSKGQLISKAIYGLLTFPKKRTDKFVLFALLLFTANKSSQIRSFFGRS